MSAVEGSEPPDREHGGVQGPWRAGRMVLLHGGRLLEGCHGGGLEPWI